MQNRKCTMLNALSTMLNALSTMHNLQCTIHNAQYTVHKSLQVTTALGISYNVMLLWIEICHIDSDDFKKIV